MQWRSAYATTAGATAGAGALHRVVTAPAGAKAAWREIRPYRLLDLRNGTAGVRTLRYPAGDVLVVSGLPGSGKSTLMARAVDAADARRIDSQDVRRRWDARTPAFVPYALYRPLVRIAHYVGLWRGLSSGRSLVVHDCGSLVWVRRWIARHARRSGRGMHLLLIDVPERTARQGQRERGRGVSSYAMARHRRAARRLIAAAESGGLPGRCASTVLLDRDAARALDAVVFDG